MTQDFNRRHTSYERRARKGRLRDLRHTKNSRRLNQHTIRPQTTRVHNSHLARRNRTHEEQVTRQVCLLHNFHRRLFPRVTRRRSQVRLTNTRSYSVQHRLRTISNLCHNIIHFGRPKKSMINPIQNAQRRRQPHVTSSTHADTVRTFRGAMVNRFDCDNSGHKPVSTGSFYRNSLQKRSNASQPCTAKGLVARMIRSLLNSQRVQHTVQLPISGRQHCSYRASPLPVLQTRAHGPRG